MEVSGLNAELIDVAVYTQQALEATARVAGLLGEPDGRGSDTSGCASRLAGEDQPALLGPRTKGRTPISTEPGRRP